ncbi:hypothetical protein Mal52_06380 [Symmachiella dynata]|uniref:Uncharacterized protein n=1 Tax=Symmachiella dynata TaxID=2527995 RepID=A0A517ZI81_9PLAN|nr:hypothetical protein Mal52_06380 [Symmachiella dynata]
MNDTARFYEIDLREAVDNYVRRLFRAENRSPYTERCVATQPTFVSVSPVAPW